MAPPQPPSKASRWGSLLQQAVAGVESRLDTILADTDDPPSQPAKPPDTITQQPVRRELPPIAPLALKEEDGLSRTRSNSRNNDRLQERLARAMAGKDNVRSGRSPAPSSEVPSRTGSPALGAGAENAQSVPEASVMGQSPAGDASMPANKAAQPATEDSQLPSMKARQSPVSNTHARHLPQEGRVSVQNGLDSTTPSRQPQEIERDVSVTSSLYDAETSSLPGLRETTKTAEEYEATLKQLRSDYEMAEMRRQDEVHTYTERIDALQAKLKLLTGEVADFARNAAASASKGSPQRKLAEQEEQIALLMAEGLKLSETELKNMTTIKKLRAKLVENEKHLSEAQQNLDKAGKTTLEVREKLKRAETAEKSANEKLRSYAKLEKEADALRVERESHLALIETLKTQVAQTSAKITANDRKAQADALEAERKLVSELRDELSNVKLDKELIQEEARAEIRELKEKADREKDRAKIVEAELRHEQSMLESKMEALRARAEEVTMGATGDAQAKLFRQIETLQTQYAVSSENWRRIEESLTARMTGLEKERDELSRKEHDLRQKAREFNTKAKRTQEELDRSLGKVQSLEQDLVERDTKLEKLRHKVEQLEQALLNERRDFTRERHIWEADLLRRIDQEKAKWQEDSMLNPASYSRSRNESPVTGSHKGSHSELHSLQPRQVRGRPISTEITSRRPDSSLDRRPSIQPLRTPDIVSMIRPDSLNHIPQAPPNGSVPHTPSIHTADQDDLFESHSSPHRVLNDMVSVSTVGAGPSVQLVERMSAAVRCLESEKAALNDELARLSAQRDEAREEVLTLMREIEQKREVDEKVKRLETEVTEINERYQTTLEMLGEKSEQVDELRADVADMKSIYRELLDKTIK